MHNPFAHEFSIDSPRPRVNNENGSSSEEKIYPARYYDMMDHHYEQLTGNLFGGGQLSMPILFNPGHSSSSPPSRSSSEGNVGHFFHHVFVQPELQDFSRQNNNVAITSNLLEEPPAVNFDTVIPQQQPQKGRGRKKRRVPENVQDFPAALHLSIANSNNNNPLAATSWMESPATVPTDLDQQHWGLAFSSNSTQASSSSIVMPSGDGSSAADGSNDANRIFRTTKKGGSAGKADKKRFSEFLRLGKSIQCHRCLKKHEHVSNLVLKRSHPDEEPDQPIIQRWGGCPQKYDRKCNHFQTVCYRCEAIFIDNFKCDHYPWGTWGKDERGDDNGADDGLDNTVLINQEMDLNADGPSQP